MVKRGRQRVKIASWIGSGSLYLLERRVIPRISKNALGRRLVIGVGRIPFRQAEVQKNDLPACVELQILRLDVAVDDRIVLVVEEIESVEQLVRPRENFVDR